MDPVLDILGRLWAELRGRDRTELERAARELPVFPVAVEDGVTQRARSDTMQCFYPPRSLVGEIPLTGLQFMLQQVCWGGLKARERTELLHDEMAAWQALFGIRDFKFPDVVRASVYPALELDLSADGAALRVRLQDMDVIAAICQLAGRTANAGSPLPYERLGSNRALFNLSRLRLPCRKRANDVERWEPAYRVYFGADWVQEDSVEHVLLAMRDRGVPTPDIAFLAPPDEFLRRLGRYQHLSRAAADEEAADEDMEVSEDEDEEIALESDEGERWLNFLTWLGVNRVLRPVSFHDVMDAGSGWLSTAGLTKPKRWVFSGRGGIWEEYARYVADSLGDDGGTATRYFYGLHDLEHAEPLLTAASEDSTSGIARALFAHLARGWPQLSSFSRLAVAISSDTAISKRTPPKPKDDELRVRADNFWLYRLQHAPWAPSTHGPRIPGRVWSSSAEVERRFGRRGAVAGDLVPLLEVDDGVPSGRVDTLAQRLGIRADLNPATFLENDARDLLRRIRDRFERFALDGALDERTLREVVRPAYRNLIELLAGPAGDDDEGDDGGLPAVLGDEPVLAQDGAGAYRFVPGHDCFYVARSGTLVRLGPRRLVTFILEASVTGRRALRQLGIRTLEDVLAWTPGPGPVVLEEDELNAFHTGLSELAPYVLARLRADRNDDRTARRDALRLRALLGAITPVESLALQCQLDGESLLVSESRDAHVGDRADGSLEAYVRWDTTGWPPTSAGANALASLFVDAMGAGAFEAYLALITADSPLARQRLLTYAGAPTDLREFRDLLLGQVVPDEIPTPVQPGSDGRTAATEGTEWLGGPTLSASASDEVRSGVIPLYRPEQLVIEGSPVVVAGVLPPDHENGDTKGGGAPGGGSSGWVKTATDLEELNAVGMYVALNFERHRLRRAGFDRAEIFTPGSPEDNAFVFDVSTSAAIKAALRGSERFREIHARLVSFGLSPDWPGFDILTLDPVSSSENRFIELKSSGVDARVQSMTWNEWKTARDSTLADPVLPVSRGEPAIGPRQPQAVPAGNQGPLRIASAAGSDRDRPATRRPATGPGIRRGRPSGHRRGGRSAGGGDRRSVMADPMSLDGATPGELLALYARILDGLLARGVVRSTNNPVADYSEYLTARALNLRLVANCEHRLRCHQRGRRPVPGQSTPTDRPKRIQAARLHSRTRSAGRSLRLPRWDPVRVRLPGAPSCSHSDGDRPCPRRAGGLCQRLALHPGGWRLGPPGRRGRDADDPRCGRAARGSSPGHQINCARGVCRDNRPHQTTRPGRPRSPATARRGRS